MVDSTYSPAAAGLTCGSPKGSIMSSFDPDTYNAAMCVAEEVARRAAVAGADSHDAFLSALSAELGVDDYVSDETYALAYVELCQIRRAFRSAYR